MDDLSKYPKGVFVLLDGEVVIIGAESGEIYRKGSSGDVYFYPKDVEVYTEDGVRKARLKYKAPTRG